MKHFANNSNLDARLFGILLSPSLLSAFVSIVLSIGLVAFSIVSSRYKGSSTRLLFLNFNADQSHQSHSSAQAIGRTLDSNKFISNLPLLLFWCLVGFVVYMFAVNIFGAVQRAAELGDELNHFTNMNRGQIIRESLEKLGIRLVVIVVWIPYILLFFHHIVPYVIGLALAASPNLASAAGVGYVILAPVVLAVSLHVHTVLLRLLVLRPRLFSHALYVA
jgi:flagellar biosynthesis protein FlhB